MTHTKDEALAERPAQQDIPDLIAGALGVSRGTAYDMMRAALADASPLDPCCWPGTSCDAQRKPLTDEQLLDILRGIDSDAVRLAPCFKAFARAIEYAHGITKGQE